MITQAEVQAALINALEAEGLSMPIDVMRMSLAGINLTAEYQQVIRRVTWEVWDQVSPVNGVSADEIRARQDVVGEAYLIYVDGALVAFQPHAPDQAGFVPMTVDDVDDLAETHATQLREELLLASLSSRLVQQWRLVAGLATGTAGNRIPAQMLGDPRLRRQRRRG